MRKRILSIALCLCLTLTLLPTAAWAAEAAGPVPTYEIDDKGYSKTYYIYANGAPLILQKGTGGDSYTVIYIDKDGDGEIGVGDTIWAPEGMNQTETGNDLRGGDCYIYGGTKENAYTGNTSIIMLGGQITGIYGGSRRGTVEGSTCVKIAGGRLSGAVYGAGAAASSVVTGDTNVEMTGGSVYWVYGGGYEGAVEGNTEVMITGGAVESTVCGGGDSSAVAGGTSVKVSGDAQIGTGEYGGNVYGGGYSKSATVGGSIAVGISGGEILRKVDSIGRTDGGDVIGSGYEAGSGDEISVSVTGGTVNGLVRVVGTRAPDFAGTLALTVGGEVKIGTENSGGIPLSVKSGETDVVPFGISSPLEEGASVRIILPSYGFSAVGNPIVATGAVEGDLEKMSFVSLPPGTSAFLDGDNIRVGVPESPDAPAYWTDDLTAAPDGYVEDGDTVTITTPEALAWLAVQVNGLNGQEVYDFDGKTVVLGGDIDLAEGFTFSEDGSYIGEGTPRQWTPIGAISQDLSDQAPFCGTFDGNGHTIRGAYRRENQETGLACGLFGYIDSSSNVGTVKNLTLENSFFSSVSSCTGSIVGVSIGTVDGCSSSAFIHVESRSGYLNGTGGIVGNNNGRAAQVVNCTFAGTVSSYCGDSVCPYIGGIVGDNLYGYVSGCRNTGAIFSKNDKVGGIVGDNQVPDQSERPIADRSGVIERCVNAGSVTAVGTGDVYVGGICGMSSWSWSHDYAAAIKNCLNLGAVSGGETGDMVGGICGYLDDTAMENCYNAAPVSGWAQVGALVGKSYQPVSVVSHSYFLQTDEVNAELPAIAASADGAPDINYVASMDADRQASGEAAWLLNAAAGDHSGLWSREGTPILADDSHKPTYKVTFRYEAGEPDVVYTGADGTAAIPDAAADKALTANGAPFTTDTVVKADTTVIVSDPPFSGGSSNTTTATEKNPDGSTTTTVTNHTTGTVTETTKRPDGSQTVVETKKDGTVTTTEQDKAGNKTETVEKADGSMTATETRKDGTKVQTETTTDGKTTAEVTVPEGTDKATVTIPTPEKPGAGIVAVIVHPDGTKELVKNALPGEDGLTVTLTEGAKLELIDNSKDFADLPDNHWAAEAVDFVTAREIFTGTGADRFSPEAPASRAQLWTILARLDGMDTSGGETWYEKGRAWAMENGVSDGSNPDGPITREQLATMLWRYAGSPAATDKELDFIDADAAGAYNLEALAWAVENGILTGIPQGSLSSAEGGTHLEGGVILDPQGEATRAQVAAMIMRFLQVNP